MYRLKKALGRGKEQLKRPDDLLYPDRPEIPLPSPLNATQLEGKYVDKGYGTLDIMAKDHGDATLAAKRPDFTQMHFRHVTGNFWTVGFYSEPSDTTELFMAGEFHIGFDGQATGFTLSLSPVGADMNEGRVFFERVR